METKMSVGLDAPISIGLTSHPWVPTPSPPPKLQTPTLEPLIVDHNPSEWNTQSSLTQSLHQQPPNCNTNQNNNNNPNNNSNNNNNQNNPNNQTPANPSPSNNPASMTLGLSTSLTPRFSPVFNSLISPGVSGEIANVPDPNIPSTSLIDLFRCSEYPFTSAPAPAPMPHAPVHHHNHHSAKRPASNPSTAQQQQQQQSSAAAAAGSSNPLSHVRAPAAQSQSQQHQQHQQQQHQQQQHQQQHQQAGEASRNATHPQSNPLASLSHAASAAAAAVGSSSAPLTHAHAHAPHLSLPMPLSTGNDAANGNPDAHHAAAAAVAAAAVAAAGTNAAPNGNNASAGPGNVAGGSGASLPLSLPPAASLPHPSANGAQQQQQQQQQQAAGGGGYHANGHPQLHGVDAAVAAVAAAAAGADPAGQMYGYAAGSPDDKDHEGGGAGLPATIHGTHSGHRSVLGSGITSTAVQEAQMQARMKAEVYANSRKRKRVDQPVETDKGEPSGTDDTKMTPEERKKKRYERRLALNRESAAVSRVRRREYVKLLEEQLVSAEKERVRLATELSDMQRQHNKLREHLQKLEGSIDGSPEN